MRQEEIIAKKQYVWESTECWDILILSKGSLECESCLRKTRRNSHNS